MAEEVFFHIDGLDPRTWAKYQAEELIKASNQKSVQVDLNPILKLRRVIKPIIYDNQLMSDARLSPVREGFRISMNYWYKNRNRERRWRFSIAHEIGHTLFYDLSISPPRHLKIPGLTANYEEKICNYFAVELLMPGGQVPDQFYAVEADQENPNFINTMLQMSRIYDVSPETMCLRIIDELLLWDGLLLFCQWDSKPSIYYSRNQTYTPESKMDWRVGWRVFSQESFIGLFIPNPDKKKGLLPKLNWPHVEKAISEMNSNQIHQIYLPISEVGRLGNLQKYLSFSFGNHPVSIWIQKSDPSTPEIWPDDMRLYNKQKNFHKTSYIAISLKPEK